MTPLSEQEFVPFMEESLGSLCYPGRFDPVSSSSNGDVLRFLCTELETEQILLASQEGEEQQQQDEVQPNEIGELDGFLNKMCLDLNVMEDLSSNSALETLRVIRTLLEKLDLSPKGTIFLSKGFFESLDEEEKKRLQEIGLMMEADYSNRHLVLKKRVEVTMQSFLWCKKGSENSNELNNLIKEKIFLMDSILLPTLYNAFTAEDHLSALLLESTSQKTSRKTPPSFVKTLRIGDVPDRGGRLEMVRAGGMPSFKPRSESGGGGGRG
eukprot:CAMPEP_0201493140 /NCGR_PEP_ID=MMETSP0151_2-20130828/36232_1 /ASSEMBLY_ACC=CAM_ASM_000257 /TAXON_ID=200890 /ORGANISM="Paramoeba atlantica, Strain 621/1 / CCAP 1560/9" /LENGTH=267 /DNA_ID=CAMNT_0047880325 /DNA_START=311 /DNA_END=1111 /DNA_ORIENTATION=-